MIQVSASVGAGEAEEALGASRAVRLPSSAPLSHKTARECLDAYQTYSLDILIMHSHGSGNSLREGGGSNVGKVQPCSTFWYGTSEGIEEQGKDLKSHLKSNGIRKYYLCLFTLECDCSLHPI